MSDPWNRRPTETRKAYAGFVAYRDLGTDRSLVKLSQQTGKHRTLYEGWSVRHGWQTRVDAWDAWKESEKQKAMHREVIEMGERQARIATAFQAKVAQAWQASNLLGNDETPPAAPRELAYIMDLSIKWERLALGQPSERIELTHQLLTPLVQQLVLIFTEVNLIEDPEVRAQEFAARADTVVIDLAERFVGAAR